MKTNQKFVRLNWRDGVCVCTGARAHVSARVTQTTMDESFDLKGDKTTSNNDSSNRADAVAAMPLKIVESDAAIDDQRDKWNAPENWTLSHISCVSSLLLALFLPANNCFNFNAIQWAKYLEFDLAFYLLHFDHCQATLATYSKSQLMALFQFRATVVHYLDSRQLEIPLNLRKRCSLVLLLPFDFESSAR